MQWNLKVFLVIALLFSFKANGTQAKRHTVLQISDGPVYDFGTVVPGNTVTRVFTVSNPGSYTAYSIQGSGLTAPFSFQGGNYPGTLGSCGAMLQNGDNCTISVNFAPSSTAPAEDTIELSYFYANQPVTTYSSTRAVSGNPGCTLIPIISNLSPSTIDLNTTQTVTINGNYFAPNSTVSVPGLTTASFNYLSPTQVQIDVTTTGATQNYNLQVANECGTGVQANAITVKQLTGFWIDLRSGGQSDADLAVQMRTGLTSTRDATGMYFGGTSSGWGNWVHFTGYEFTRGNLTAFEIVFTKTAAATFMVGIGSDQQNFTSGSQWNQAEVELYTFTTSLWGYYGNTGTPGNTWNQAIGGPTIAYGNHYKVRFNSDGSTGNNIVVTRVSATNWTTDLATIATTVSTNTAAQTNLRPMVLPNTIGTNYRIVAFRLVP